MSASLTLRIPDDESEGGYTIRAKAPLSSK